MGETDVPNSTICHFLSLVYHAMDPCHRNVCSEAGLRSNITPPIQRRQQQHIHIKHLSFRFPALFRVSLSPSSGRPCRTKRKMKSRTVCPSDRYKACPAQVLFVAGLVQIQDITAVSLLFFLFPERPERRQPPLSGRWRCRTNKQIKKPVSFFPLLVMCLGADSPSP